MAKYQHIGIPPRTEIRIGINSYFFYQHFIKMKCMLSAKEPPRSGLSEERACQPMVAYKCALRPSGWVTFQPTRQYMYFYMF